MNDLKAAFETVTSGHDLTRADARAIFERIMAGDVPNETLAGLLGALATKGEAVEEIVGAAEAMRANMVPIRCDADCIDTCGTGGDGIRTFNVSTTAAIVAAAAGATVAKHGNRSTTRASGSTEVLEQLGIDVNADPTVVEKSLATARIGYLNARDLHPAAKRAAPVRQAIPVRTIFNLLGPLANPAGAKRQVLGVPRPELADKIAAALVELGAVHAWVVHGDDGLCDLTITAPTTVLEVRDGSVHRLRVAPEDVGMKRAPLGALQANSPQESAAIVLDVLQKQTGPPRDHVLLNAGAALVVAGRVEDLREGTVVAARAIDSGAAVETLNLWRSIAGKPSDARTRDASG